MRSPLVGQSHSTPGQGLPGGAARAGGLDPEPLAGYLEAFKYGMPPERGGAIGLERWVAQLVGAANIRETMLFPRDLHRLPP